MKIILPNFWRIAFFLVLLSFLLVGCYNPLGLFKKSHHYTAEDIMEAKVIALCLSEDITAPDGLCHRVLKDLADIRSSCGDNFTQINTIRFRAPWVPSCIIIGFESGISRLVANGQYNAWDELNKQYQVSEINLRSIEYNWVVLSFKGQLHPRRLSELYAKLPGVKYAEPNGKIGDGSTIYPSSQTMSGLTYLFKNGEGDCPAGCTSNEYWYFVAYESREAIFIGYWNPQKDPKKPDWWSDAEWNIEQYRKF